ncbi:MAG: M23 family metallopeptidase [Actinobacteria bacterium]|nr:M23 family metallopeptidase [Actinomycetota bacterium]MCB8997485.1 M23 family metallopeptidase [Actinomycetota bacterium]
MKKTLIPVLGAGVAAGLLIPAVATPAHADSDRQSVASAATFTKLPTRNYKLSAKFGQRGRLWSSGRHTGLDFSAPRGTRVNAVADGKVVFSGWAGAYGKAVIIKHKNGKRSLYGHMSKTLVRKGKKVTAGQKIGKVGSTGNSTGPHLHFEVRSKNGKKLDPRPHLRGE